MKVSDLKEKTSAELNQIVLDSMRKLFDLRMQKDIGAEVQVKSHHFKEIRRLIARIKTILTQKARTA
jgi:large subunit ribosomal protein L29